VSKHAEFFACFLRRLTFWTVCVALLTGVTRAQTHWALKTPVRPPLPRVANAAWPRSAIDDFILARLERAGLVPAAEAGRQTLIRRVTLDLTGLPPTPAEVAAFSNDESDDAYENVVDRLLRSRRYGERMAVEWLDAARYSDTYGYHEDLPRVMWPWRDWVINALNDNMPFDRFTVEQLAGDLLPSPTTEQLVATGFNRLHGITSSGIAEEYRVESIVDRVATTATTWLGLTLGCARCHDHMYDELTQREFYEFYAFFATTSDAPLMNRSIVNIAPVVELPTPRQRATLAEITASIERLTQQQAERADHVGPDLATWEAGRLVSDSRLPAAPAESVEGEAVADVEGEAVADVPDDAAAGTPPAEQPPAVDRTAPLLAVAANERTPEQQQQLQQFFLEDHDPTYRGLTKQISDFEEEKVAIGKRIPSAMIMEELPERPDVFFLNRGQYDQPGETVMAGVPACLPALSSGDRLNRLDLAQWLVDPAHPLTARVAVNRLWQIAFGGGIVATPDDFGVQGASPSHPDLLDYLATEFIASGWDVKSMMHRIVTSATYRQSSLAAPELVALDPDNRLLARGSRHRLAAEMIRDSALAVSGLLVERLGGPSVKPYQPPGLWHEMSHDTYEPDKGENLYRRSLYTYRRRTTPPPNMTAFDAPSGEVCTVRRQRTNTPLMALVTLNDPTFVEAARALAQQILTDQSLADATPDERIRSAFKRALARVPEPLEIDALGEVYRHEIARHEQDSEAAAQLLAVGDSPRDESLDAVEHAAWTVVANVILNTDEFVTKE